MSHLCDMSARADIRAATAENVRYALLLLSPANGQRCALRAEFSSLSFPKEKESKKKGNLRAAPLKIPLLYRAVMLNQKRYVSRFCNYGSRFAR